MYVNDVCIWLPHLPSSSALCVYQKELYIYIYISCYFLFLLRLYLSHRILLYNEVYIIKAKNRTVPSIECSYILSHDNNTFSIFFFFLASMASELSRDNCFFFVDCLYIQLNDRPTDIC
jgi:hypothetical protein